jgi:hypothetical protein
MPSTFTITPLLLASTFIAPPLFLHGYSVSTT